MSYRALITIQSLNEAGEVENACHATTFLDEEFKRGEHIAHIIDAERHYPGAAHFVATSGDAFALSYRGVEWDGLEDYRSTWADQEWTISFQRRGDYCRVVISGKDSGGEEIFRRVTVYGF